jgi:SAM-dependent methyltransferase
MDDRFLLWIGLAIMAIPLTRTIWRFFMRKRPFYWVWNKKRRVLLVEKQKYFDTLYQDSPAFSHSRQDRDNLSLNSNYVYGEIVFSSFVFLLDQVKAQPWESFYDLGCGAGKSLCVAALTSPCQRIIGVEALESLCVLARQYTSSLKQCTIIQADLCHYDFSEANIVFINATCFQGELWETLCKWLARLKKGSRVILGTHFLPADTFYCMYSDRVEMSWGLSRVSVYRKEIE